MTHARRISATSVHLHSYIIFLSHYTSTFLKRNGEEMTYVKYYAHHYNKKITEMQQPLLVHRHRRKGAPTTSVPSGTTGVTQYSNEEVIFLIPELCTMTGFSDNMRSDFSVMKDVSNHTRVFPDIRAAELQKFVEDINSNPHVTRELEEWLVQIQPEMMVVEGRLFDAEKIYFNRRSAFVDQRTGKQIKEGGEKEERADREREREIERGEKGECCAMLWHSQQRLSLLSHSFFFH